MKKILIFIFLLSASFAWAQEKINIFETKTMTFYGLDFTHAKFIGTKKLPNPEDLVHKYYPQWYNMFMADESDVEIGGSYKKKEVFYDTMIYSRNAKIDTKTIITDQEYSLNRSDINEYLLSYAIPNKSGLGMVYLVEALNASEKHLSIWITFFDIKTGEVLLTEPIRAKGNGRKFKYWWKNAFLELFDDSSKDYKAWKKIYK